MVFIKIFTLCLFILGSFKANSENKPQIVIVYSTGGKGDSSFNAMSYKGVLKAKEEFKENILEIEPFNQAEIYLNFEKYAAPKKLIISLGFESAASLEKAAKQFPETTFGFIDMPIIANNISSYTFKENEGSFLAGYLAAKFSKTNKIGFIGGVDIPPIQRFLSGYQQGALYANQSIIIYKDYIGNNGNAWLNPIAGKKLARKQYSQGADIVFAVAGGSNLGVFDATREAKKFAIGVDSNQNNFAPGHILTSVIKRVDIATYKIISSYLKKNLKLGTFELGLKDEGVDLAIDQYTKNIVSNGILNEIQKIKEEIIEGKIIVK